MVLPSILLLMFIFFQSTPVKGQHCEELLKYRVDMEELLVRMHTSDSVSYFTAVLKKEFHNMESTSEWFYSLEDQQQWFINLDDFFHRQQNGLVYKHG